MIKYVSEYKKKSHLKKLKKEVKATKKGTIELQLYAFECHFCEITIYLEAELPTVLCPICVNELTTNNPNPYTAYLEV